MKRKAPESKKSGKAAPEDEFEVEEILDHRENGDHIEYRVRWSGYTEDEDWWILDDNIDCPQILGRYWLKKWKSACAENKRKVNYNVTFSGLPEEDEDAVMEQPQSSTARGLSSEGRVTTHMEVAPSPSPVYEELLYEGNGPTAQEMPLLPRGNPRDSAAEDPVGTLLQQEAHWRNIGGQQELNDMVWQALQPGSSGVQQFIQRASPSEAARNRRLGIHDYEAYFDHRQSPSEMNNDDHHSITFRSPSPQSTTATPEPEFGPSSTDPDSDARFSYNPWSPAYSPSSPAYSPPSPAYSPSLPAYSPSSPPDPRSTWFTSNLAGTTDNTLHQSPSRIPSRPTPPPLPSRGKTPLFGLANRVVDVEETPGPPPPPKAPRAKKPLSVRRSFGTTMNSSMHTSPVGGPFFDHTQYVILDREPQLSEIAQDMGCPKCKDSSVSRSLYLESGCGVIRFTCSLCGLQEWRSTTRFGP